MRKAIRLQPMVFVTIIIWLTPFVAHAQSKYSQTIAVLQDLYSDEMKAHLTYLAFNQKALSEDYPNIAHLFVALATSESIHALNFKQLLAELKVEVKEMPQPEIEVSSTKKNLRYATQVELKEIDQRYPQFIDRIKRENHEAAI
jgi:rubrerythrin